MTRPDRIFFYPHGYLRDRQLDVIRNWPQAEVLNPEVAARGGAQVDRQSAVRPRMKFSRVARLPLVNLKTRPGGAGPDAVLYIWGGIPISGPYILDLDNPFALTGYNLKALRWYAPLIRRLLLSRRCREIRCMSAACRKTLEAVLGPAVAAKAEVHYPRLPRRFSAWRGGGDERCRFLFVGTQFEIKGGAALLRAFAQVHREFPRAELDIVTHLPREYDALARSCPGIRVHEARFSRSEIEERFISQSDVLVHPTYVDSFGMVVLEALSYGLPAITTDVYALPEMVEDGCNGIVLHAPLSIWDGFLPSRHYHELENIKQHIRAIDTRAFEAELAKAFTRFLRDRQFMDSCRRNAQHVFDAKFARV